MSKWFIKKKIFCTLLLSSENKPIFKIIFHKGKYEITGVKSDFFIVVSKRDDNILAIEGAVNGHAVLQYGKEIFLLPSRAVIADVTLEDKQYTLQQMSERDFLIQIGVAPIGKIENMLKRIVFAKTPDMWMPEITAVFYALADFMLHEDDTYIV